MIDQELIKQELTKVIKSRRFNKKNLSNLAGIALRAYPDVVRDEVRKLVGAEDNDSFYAAVEICGKAGISVADLASDKLLPHLDRFGFGTLLDHFLEASDDVFVNFLRVASKDNRFKIIETYESTEIIRRLSEIEEPTDEILELAECVLDRKGVLDKPLDSYITRSLATLSNHSERLRSSFLIAYDNLLEEQPSSWRPELKNIEIITSIKNVKEKERRKPLVTKAILLRDEDLNKRIMREFRRYKKYFNLV